MKTASLVHVEIATEYYKDGSLYYPSSNEKLLWDIFGTPENVIKNHQIFETEIDVLTGFTKKEVEHKVNENFKNEKYNYLPAMGVNNTIELRF